MSESERHLLLTVEEAFHVSGRGCLLTPGLPADPSLPLRRGDAVHLLQPNGQATESAIAGIDAVHNRNTDSPEIRFFVTLPRQVKKEDVPKGTLVYLAAKATTGA